MRLTVNELDYCLNFCEGKVSLPNTKNAYFPESLLPSYANFYDVWVKFWQLIDPILDLEFYDVFYSSLGDVAYYRYRQVGIDTVRDFLIFCCTHTKRECNILLRENNPKSYTRHICFSCLRELIYDRCPDIECPHREEVFV